MQHIKNITDYLPENGDKNIRYSKDEQGRDWYELQDTFQPDTLKVLYSEDGSIVDINQDVTALVPYDNESVIEIEFDQDVVDYINEEAMNIFQYVLIDGKLHLKPSMYHVFENGEWIITEEGEKAQNKEIRSSKLRELITIKKELMDEGFNFMNNKQSCSTSELSKLQLLIDDLKDFEEKNPDKVATKTVFWNFADGESRDLMLFEVEILRQQVVAWIKALEQTQSDLLKSVEPIDFNENGYLEFKSKAQELWMEYVN